MKKLFITMAFVAAGLFASAQGLFVGGSLGFATQGGKDVYKLNGVETTIDAPKIFVFDVNPEIGFMFSDNMGAGVEFGFGFGRGKIENDGVTTTVKTTNWKIAPYFRYVFAEPGDFRFYADAKVSLSGDKPKTTVEEAGISTTFDGDKTLQFGAGIVPGMQFYVSDNFLIDAKLNIFSLGYSMTKVTSKDVDTDGDEYVVKTNGFGFGINDPTDLSIGFIYTF